MVTYYALYSLFVAIWIFTDAPSRNVSRWWALGAFILPIVVPLYFVKTRSLKAYWKNIGLWLLGFFVAHIVGAAMLMPQTKSIANKPLNQPVSVKKFISPDNRFCVIFPTEPKRESDIVNAPKGKIEMIQYISQTGGIQYEVIYSDLPTTAFDGRTSEQMLDGARDGMVENVAGKLTSETIISRGNNPGREITVKVKPDTIIKTQIVLQNNRFYQLMVTSPSDKLFVARYREFFDSFKILR